MKQVFNPQTEDQEDGIIVERLPIDIVTEAIEKIAERSADKTEKDEWSAELAKIEIIRKSAPEIDDFRQAYNKYLEQNFSKFSGKEKEKEIPAFIAATETKNLLAILRFSSKIAGGFYPDTSSKKIIKALEDVKRSIDIEMDHDPRDFGGRGSTINIKEFQKTLQNLERRFKEVDVAPEFSKLSDGIRLGLEKLKISDQETNKSLSEKSRAYGALWKAACRASELILPNDSVTKDEVPVSREKIAKEVTNLLDGFEEIMGTMPEVVKLEDPDLERELEKMEVEDLEAVDEEQVLVTEVIKNEMAAEIEKKRIKDGLYKLKIGKDIAEAFGDSDSTQDAKDLDEILKPAKSPDPVGVLDPTKNTEQVKSIAEPREKTKEEKDNRGIFGKIFDFILKIPIIGRVIGAIAEAIMNKVSGTQSTAPEVSYKQEEVPLTFSEEQPPLDQAEKTSGTETVKNESGKILSEEELEKLEGMEKVIKTLTESDAIVGYDGTPSTELPNPTQQNKGNLI